MVTAKGEEADIVEGLEVGADDYITKPFSPRVLVARVQAVLRRGRPGSAGGDKIEPAIRIRELSIDTQRYQASVAGKRLELTVTEFQILAFLAKRAGWVFTRQQIVEAVRGVDYHVTDRAVDVAIFGLRKKLGEYSEYIETVRGIGYRFVEDAEESDS
jgi:two-component system phosphate regulon response regulator PhoB